MAMIHSDPQSADLGRVTCSLKGRVAAGSYQTCVLTYTAGFAGIDDTGSLKVVVRYATDSGRPQFDDPAAPHYVTAAASNGAHLQLRYDLKDHVRPWGKTIHIKVLQGYLRKGDTITLTLGDRTGGSPGWRMQTFLEETFEFRVFVDRYATYVYEQVASPPTLRIVAGEPVRCVAIAPSLVQPGRKFTIRYKLEDVWGNPVGRPKKETHTGFETEGCYRVTIVDKPTGLSAETNPVLVRPPAQFGCYWADLHGQSEETVGTNSIESYFRFARDVAFLDACAHQGNDFQITDDFWLSIQDTTARFQRDGKFVTFPGWEWSGNTGLGGDRNVLFKEEGGPITRSSRALVDTDDSRERCSETVEELFDSLKSLNTDVMTIAHVGGRYADLDRHREHLETAVEVHSAWGTFEWMLSDAFERGYRVAIVANSDGHKGRPGASYPGASTFGSYGGLTCVLAERLDRDAVWEAYQQRRVFATTGARMLVEFDAGEGIPMGSVLPIESDIPGKDGVLPEFRIAVHGTAPIERIEIRNAMRVLKTFRTYRSGDLTGRVKLLWQGAAVRGRGRQVNWNGELRLKSNTIRSLRTINFHNPEKPCRQISKTHVAWESLTTGGVAGLIFDLDRPAAGDLNVVTTHKRFQVPIGKLGIRGRQYQAGGLGKQIAVCRLPAANGPCDWTGNYRIKPSDLQSGDNPIYVHVVQEDGHMAWSSPIYVVS